LKVVLVGAVESTEVTLRSLIRYDIPPVLVITLPAALAGRHSDFVDIGSIAAAHGIEVMHAPDVNAPEIMSRIGLMAPDLVFVVGWSRLCSAEFLKLPSIGAIGYHPALLPALRGRSVLSWTLLLKSRRTGGTLFWIDDGTDSGSIAVQEAFELPADIYLGELLQKHMLCLGRMLDNLLPRLKRGERPATPQDERLASYAARRGPEDGLIDWRLPAEEVACLVRSVSHPYPGAFTLFRKSILRVWRARVTDHCNWHAQTGQAFLYENGSPIIRCGGMTSLLLEEYEIEDPGGMPVTLKGQVILGTRDSSYG
jgi:methionyl-tRNA formyltransferase